MESGKKPNQLLRITPSSELVFHAKPDDDSGICYSQILLHNPTSSRLMFKVKTTAPKRYCVRPNSGIVDKNETISVEVMLPASDASSEEKSRHKFMVQSIVLQDQQGTDVDSLWKAADQKDIMDSKLRCSFPSDDTEPKSTPTSTAHPSAPLSSVGSGDGYHLGGSYPLEQPSSTKPGGGEDDVKHLQELIKQLSNETRELRSENALLREENVLRQRKPAPASASPSPGEVGVRSPSAAPAPVFPPLLYIVAALIIGLILGKFLLP